MNTRRTAFTVAVWSIFLLHQYLQKGLGYAIPWVHSYLDPLLCFPILLDIWERERQWFWTLPPLSASEIFGFTLLLSGIFELVFPRFSPHFTADWADVPAYFVGSVTYFYYYRPHLQNSISKKPYL